MRPFLLARIFGIAVVCILPLALLLDFDSTFSGDWINHLWTIEYFGEYLKQHLRPPDVLSTDSLIGVPLPLFYSAKFYAATGAISAWIGPAAAFRVVAVLAMFVQFYHVERAARSGLGRGVSFTVAALVTWSIYPLTNLYNRSALTEFIAGCFLTAAVSSLFVLIRELVHERKSSYDSIAFGLLFAVAAMTHPPTAFFGCFVLITIGLIAAVTLRRLWIVAIGGTHALLVCGILSPWLYVLRRFGKSLPISDPGINRFLFRRWYFFPDSIDNFWSRFSLLPTDWANVDPRIPPYMDTQIAVPLVALGIVLFLAYHLGASARRLRRDITTVGILWGSVGLFAVFLIVSLYPRLSGLFGGLFDILQFPYRLVTFINVAALSAVLALIALVDRSIGEQTLFKTQTRNLVLLLVFVVSLTATVAKLIRASTVRSDDLSANIERWARSSRPLQLDPLERPRFDFKPTDLPITFYGMFDYSVRSEMGLAPANGFGNRGTTWFFVEKGPHFGRVSQVGLDLYGPSLIMTNVVPFPWNVLSIDGVQQSPSQLIALDPKRFPSWMRAYVVGVPVSSGKHLLRYEFRPDRAWRILALVSWIILAAWATIWLLFPIWRLVQRRSARSVLKGVAAHTEDHSYSR